LGLRHTGFSLFRIYADKTTVQQNIQRQCALYSKHFLPICLTVVEDDFTLVLVIQENQRIPTLSSHRTNCTNSILQKLKFAIKPLKVADGFMRKDNAIKIQYTPKYASIANYWKKWIGNPRTSKSIECRSRKERPKKRFSKITKAGKEKDTELFFDFEKNYAAIPTP
jgi:hypothetical protein